MNSVLGKLGIGLFSPVELVIGQEEMAWSSAKKLAQLDWILGKISPSKQFSGIGTDCPGISG